MYSAWQSLWYWASKAGSLEKSPPIFIRRLWSSFSEHFSSNDSQKFGHWTLTSILSFFRVIFSQKKTDGLEVNIRTHFRPRTYTRLTWIFRTLSFKNIIIIHMFESRSHILLTREWSIAHFVPSNWKRYIILKRICFFVDKTLYTQAIIFAFRYLKQASYACFFPLRAWWGQFTRLITDKAFGLIYDLSAFYPFTLQF